MIEVGVTRPARPANRFHQALLKHFEADPTALFCYQVGLEGEVAISWGDLEASCGAFQDAYRRAGVTSGGQVLIFLRHTPHLYGAFFGAMLVGMTPAFMPCSSPRQDPRSLLALARRAAAADPAGGHRHGRGDGG